MILNVNLFTGVELHTGLFHGWPNHETRITTFDKINTDIRI